MMRQDIKTRSDIMFYKVENERLVKAPEKSLKLFIANPTDEQYRFFGYTDEIIEDERPEEKEGYYIEEWYEQIGSNIFKHYRYVEIPQEIPLVEEVIEDEGI